MNVNCNDKVIQQLLKKLEEGSATIFNLRSLLTLKTVELNELLHQLELIDQVLTRVETSTEKIEATIQGVLSCTTEQDKLLDAEATLDSAIKSACNLYSIDKNSSLLGKIKKLLIDLNKPKNDDTNVLQKKAYHDPNSEKTMAISMHPKNTLIKRKSPPTEKIKQTSFITLLDREQKQTVNNKHCVDTKKKMTSLQSISRPTSSSMAKSKDKKSLPSHGPGSTLRLRNMLAKRNPALKMITEQSTIASSTVY